MQMTRRDFLRSAAMSAALAAVAGPAGVARAAEANAPEKWVKGVCRYCGTGCGVLVGVKNGKAVAIKGDPNNHNQGFLCLKGALLIPVLNSPDRVTKPMIRRTKGGRLEPISWDEALDHMAKKFRTTIDTYGPDAVAWYGSGQCLTELSCERIYGVHGAVLSLISHDLLVVGNIGYVCPNHRVKKSETDITDA